MACVAAPIIGGPRPLTQATTHPPKPSISHTYDTLKHEEPVTYAYVWPNEVALIEVNSNLYAVVLDVGQGVHLAWIGAV